MTVPSHPSDDAFAPFAARMAAAGVPEVAVRGFAAAYAALRAGDAGLIGADQALPPDDLPGAADLGAFAEAGRAALDRTAILKLNGGLGTSMGLRGPKSLVPVRDGLTFLDLAARQVLALRAQHGARLPLVLMNSFATREASLAALAAYPDLAAQDVPPDFVQHRVPKVDAATLAPAEWPADPEKTWCPPGHGDLYPALVSSGLLARLLERGYRHAFVSNVDNLGAVLDLGLLGWAAAEGVPFAMEVADRTAADRKGGHLARRPDGGLLLRELAQCPPEELEAFQDIARFRYFNTNSLWLDLAALDAALEAHGGFLPLPMIRNAKPVDPTDPGSPPVYQLETAMGSAIAVLPGARAVRVPRTRFAPVKRTDDLLVLRSDAYAIDDGWRVVPAPALRDGDRSLPRVALDPRCYGALEDLEARFPFGPPSLVGCRTLTVRGDVRFGRGVVVRGDVVVDGDVHGPLVEDGAVLVG